MKVRLLLLFLAAWLFATAPAQAQGCPPDGLPGDIVYNGEYGVFQGCTPLGWKAFHGMPASFFPAQIPGLVLWLDASDTGAMTASGTAVSQWKDKSGGGNHFTQSSGSKRPATGTRTANGLNVLDFDGGDWLINTSLNSIYTGAYTMFIVVGGDNNTVDHMLIASDGSNLVGIRQNSSTAIVGYNGDGNVGAGRATVAVTESLGALRTNAIRRDGTAFHLWSDGGAGAAGTSNALDITATDTRIGGRLFFGTQLLDGPVAEALIYSRALTDAEMNQIGNYLAGKWGLSWTNM